MKDGRLRAGRASCWGTVRSDRRCSSVYQQQQLPHAAGNISSSTDKGPLTPITHEMENSICVMCEVERTCSFVCFFSPDGRDNFTC